MSQRKRRSKGGAESDAPPRPEIPPAGSTADTGEVSEASAQPPSTPAPSTPAPSGTPSALPAFGFAADILQGRRAGAEAKATASPAPGGAAAPAPTPEAALDEVDPDDPNRIFAFADSLERQGRSREEATAAPQLLQGWVTLQLADETFALPVEAVREVLRVSAITRVPHAPYPIRGVTNLRGRVIPVIDLRRRLELAEADLERGSRIVVVESRRRLIGLLVDAVRQVLQVDLNRVQPAPDDVMTEQSDYILGVFHSGETLVLLLDVDRVLVIKEAGSA